LALNTHIPLTAPESVKLGWIILVALEDRFDLRHRRSSSVAIGKAPYSMRLRSRVLARDARSATGNFAALSDFGAEARVLK
jgi:hypothetical protein